MHMSRHVLPLLCTTAAGVSPCCDDRKHGQPLTFFAVCIHQAWVKEMAGFVKSIAPNQLIGLGDEGFATFLNDADSSTLVDSNPGTAAALYRPWRI